MKKDSLGVSGNGVETIIHRGNDELIIQNKQDIQPILAANKRAQSEGVNMKSAIRHAAQIPIVIWEQWMKEFKKQNGKDYNAANRETREKYLFGKLNDPDNKYFRTWQGKL